MLNGASYCRHACNDCEGACPFGVPIADVLRTRMYATDYGDVAFARREYAALDGSPEACLSCTGQPCRVPARMACRSKRCAVPHTGFSLDMTTLIATDAAPTWPTEADDPARVDPRARRRADCRIRRHRQHLSVAGGPSTKSAPAPSRHCVSASLASWEQDAARGAVAEIGGRHRTVETQRTRQSELRRESGESLLLLQRHVVERAARNRTRGTHRHTSSTDTTSTTSATIAPARSPAPSTAISRAR